MRVRKLLSVMMLIGIIGLTGCGDKVTDNNVNIEDNADNEVIEEEQDKEEQPEEKPDDKLEKTDKEITKEFLLGTWGNETAFSDDETMKFSMAYYTEFKEDGSIIQTGYRNKDKGTFEIVNKDVAIALFDHNYYEDPADPDNNEPVDGYVYEVIYHINHEDGTIDAEYSNEFNEMCMSNAEDGVLTKIPDEELSGIVEE